MTAKARVAFEQHPNRRRSESALRELHKQVTYSVYAEEDDLGTVTTTR